MEFGVEPETELISALIIAIIELMKKGCDFWQAEGIKIALFF